MFAYEDLINRRAAALLELGREPRGLDILDRSAAGCVGPLASMQRQVAQQGVNDRSKGRDLHLDLRGRMRARHRHFISSIGWFASPMMRRLGSGVHGVARPAHVPGGAR